MCLLRTRRKIRWKPMQTYLSLPSTCATKKVKWKIWCNCWEIFISAHVERWIVWQHQEGNFPRGKNSNDFIEWLHPLPEYAEGCLSSSEVGLPRVYLCNDVICGRTDGHESPNTWCNGSACSSFYAGLSGCFYLTRDPSWQQPNARICRSSFVSTMTRRNGSLWTELPSHL